MTDSNVFGRRGEGLRDTELFEGGTNQENDSPQTKVQYPRNWIQETSAGHRIEMNNTEDAERIRILNANGNFIDLDEKNDNYLKSKNDTYILSDHNLVIKVGKDIKTDKVVLQVIGDVNLYVEGDMHTEVEGNRFDRVNGNYQMQVGGVCTIQSDENLAIQAANEMRLKSNAYTNKTTFLENDLSEGGSVKENVKGNYEIRIQKPTAVFSVHSEGNMAFKTLGTLYEVTDGNEYHTVFGKVRETVYGNERSPLAGGNFVGAVDAPQSFSYFITVTGGMQTTATSTINVHSDANVNITGAEIYLN